MPLIYGEGDNAFQRLQKELAARSVNGDSSNLQDGTPSVSTEIKALGSCLQAAPYIRQDLFIGRKPEIEKIHSLLWKVDVLRRQQRVVLGGIGGVGKTQLAVAYAREYESFYTTTVWLNATSVRTLQASFQSVAERLIAPQELGKLGQEQIVRRIRSWLSNTDNAQWLLIFDNYDDPDQFDIDSFYPNTNHGSIMITTRRPDAVDGETVQIQPLVELDDSLDILQSRSQRVDIRHNLGARALAQRLAGLPLALVTAGAYLCNNGISFQEYLETYERRWQVSRRPVLLREYQDRTLFNTWDMTYSLLKTEHAEAAQMLRLLAYFDHQEIWYELFKAGSEHAPPWLSTAVTDRVDFADVLGTLVKYGLVSMHHVTPSYSMYSMHSCVHDWTLGALNAELDPQLHRHVLHCVASSINNIDYDKWSHVQHAQLSCHAVRLTHSRFKQDDQLSTYVSEDFREVAWVARLLRKQMHFSAAEQMYEQVLLEYGTALGPHHTSTLDMVQTFGLLYFDQGKLGKAEQLYLRALAATEEAHGPHHMLTLTRLIALGALYGEQGKLAEAEQMFIRALTGCHEAVGPYHKRTIDVTHNLANLYAFDYGKLVQAEQLFEQALDGYEKTYGPHHLSTLDLLYSLGNLYSIQGKLVAAEQLYTRALIGYEEALSPHHTSILTTVCDLGIIYAKRGQLPEAGQMYEQVLAGYKEVLEEEHPWRLSRTYRHADLFVLQLDFDKAKQMYQEIIDLCAKSLPGTASRYQRVAEFNIRALGKMVGLGPYTSVDARAYLYSLVQYLKHENRISIIMIQYLIKALVHLGDEANVRPALFCYVIQGKELPLDLGGICCDACHCRLNIDMGVNVCRKCVDTNLCDTCLSTKYTRSNLVSRCHHNRFYDLGRTIREALHSSNSQDSTEIKGLLNELAQKYARLSTS